MDSMIQKINIEKLNVAEYNPRIALEPDMPEYQKLKNSIEKFGMVEPIIWNKRTGNVVGGHQRLKVLTDKGEKEVECSIVDINEKEEKKLNILLNKAKGYWNISGLTDVLQELNECEMMDLTGFEEWELESLNIQYEHINDLLEKDFSGYSETNVSDTFAMTFTLPEKEREAVERYIKNTKNAKTILASEIINKIKEEQYAY
jgi:ParB-like chromosome segregation protein Spo0J